jgi:hypothetical protein
MPNEVRLSVQDITDSLLDLPAISTSDSIVNTDRYSMKRLSKTATKDTSKRFKIGVLIALRSSRRFARSYLIVLCKYFLFLSEIIILIALILRSRNAGATPLEAKPRMTDEAKARAKKELEGRTGDTDSEAEGSEGLDDI